MGSNIDVSSTGALVNRLMNPPNPMEQLGQTIQGVNALKDFQARNAMAGIYSQAIDPTTGEVDQGLLNRLIGANPAAAWNAGPAMQQAGQAVGAQGAGTQNWVKAQQDQLQLLNGYAQPLYERIANGGSVSADDVRGVLKNAIGISPQMRAAVEQKLAGLNPGEDANGLLKGFQFATQTPEAQASRNFPTVGQNIDISKWLSDQSAPWPDKNDPTKLHYGTNADRIQNLYGQPGLDAIIKGWGGGGYGPGAGGATSGAPAPTTPGSTPGAGNWEVQHNNFAGMRNPNVPAAGGPNTNPGGWQQFPTPEAGVQAISRQLDRYASGATTGKPLNTLNGIISTWAPPSDGNPTPALIARASRIMGVGPDQPLDLSNPEVKAKLVEAMIRNEQGGNLPASAAAAIPAALSAPGFKPYGGSAEPAVARGPAGGGATTLVPGGGAQLPPGVQLAGFPTGGAGTMPVTFPATTKASGEQYLTDLSNYNQLPTRLSPLTQAADILRANPTLGTGTGAEDIQKLASLATNFGFSLSPAATTNLAAFTEINKDLERYYLNLGGSQRSDLAQTETKMSQPSTQMQREALDDLVARTIGLERANSAPMVNFQHQHGEANAENYAPQYQSEAAAYRNQIDPVAFGFDYMTTQQRRAYLDSLPNEAARQRYFYSLKEASRLYNLPLPRQ